MFVYTYLLQSSDLHTLGVGRRMTSVFVAKELLVAAVVAAVAVAAVAVAAAPSKHEQLRRVTKWLCLAGCWNHGKPHSASCQR